MIVFMFPGQSSCYPGMIPRLAGLCTANARLLARASEILGRDLAHHYRSDAPAPYERNQDVQIGVFLASQMFLTALEEAGVRAGASLGLSLGEYNHLVHIGALDVEEALLLVSARGEAYDAGPRGCMAAVHLDADLLAEVVAREEARHGFVEIVNLNSPRQSVIAGERAAVLQLGRILEEEHLAVVTMIEERVPMHSALFAPVAERFRTHLEAARFHTPALPYVPNRLGRILGPKERPDVVELLAAHVHSPVLWRRSVEAVCEKWPDAVLVEVGPRAVLFNLLRKWRPNRRYHTDVEGDLAPHLQSLVGELRAVEPPPAPTRPKSRAQLIDELSRAGRRGPIFAPGPTTARVSIAGEALGQLLPQRDPFLFVDRIDWVDLDVGAIRGTRRIDERDPVFAGHFPGDPVYPGVLQLEAIGQLGLCLEAMLRRGGISATAGDRPGSLRLLKVHEALMLAPVRPGTELVLVARSVEQSDYVSTCVGQAMVGGEVAALAAFEVYHAD